MWGHLMADGEARTLTFERDIARPIEKVFAALITPARVADWLCADADIEPRVGGRFHLTFRNYQHTMEGLITRFEPPHTLEYTWPEDAAKGCSRVLWRLHATPSGTRLVLTHMLPHGGDMADFASGWHWHLDALPAACDAAATEWNEPAWRVLQLAYAERLGA
jgi:uncharacterized protein YndB with AHSA1/START domain